MLQEPMQWEILNIIFMEAIGALIPVNIEYDKGKEIL